MNVSIPKSEKEVMEAIRALFYYGQLLTFGPTVFIILYLALAYPTTTSTHSSMLVAVVIAFISVVLSLCVAVMQAPTSRLGMGLLTLSLILGVMYIAILVGCTGGSESSVFQNFYLYMPSVVYMVTINRRWPQYLCAALCWLSYIATLVWHDAWPSWVLFRKEGTSVWLNATLVFLFLSVLCEVNRKMESLGKQNEATKPTGS